MFMHLPNALVAFQIFEFQFCLDNRGIFKPCYMREALKTDPKPKSVYQALNTDPKAQSCCNESKSRR